MEENSVPYYVLEKYFAKKYYPYYEIIDNYFQYLSSYFGVKKDTIIKYYYVGYKTINQFDIKIPYETRPGYKEDGYEITFYRNGEIDSHLVVFDSKNGGHGTLKKDTKTKGIKNSTKTKEFAKKMFDEFYKSNSSDIETIQFDIGEGLLKIHIYKGSKITFEVQELDDQLNYNTIYSKTIEGKKESHSFGEHSTYTEEEIAKKLASMRVDISKLPEEDQENIKQLFLSSLGNLNAESEARLKEFRELQINRIMLAYQKFKEITELLNDTKMDLKFDRVKIDNLKSVIFKNGGRPNNKGYIEFEDFFKNNMILRMLDLRDLDLTNVDIRNMDFSGTNIHIKPQVVYNKDMTGVNATDVEFSPFTDDFSDTILDGTIINDYKAQIKLDRTKSHNDAVITKEVISRFR